MAIRFPRSIESRLLGSLVLHEQPLVDSEVARHYSPKQPAPMLGSVRVIVWPPKDGVPDPTGLGVYVDRRFEDITSNLGRIVAAAEPVVAAALREFCDPSLLPTTGPFLQSLRLDMIKINADGDDELQFHDVADMIGSHDLLLGLGAKCQPTYATFGG